MALTDYDRQNLSASQQAAVEKATADWNAANARGDTAGMQAAHAAAEAARNSGGYSSDSWGNYSGSYSSGSSGSSGGSSRYYDSGGSSNSGGNYSNYSGSSGGSSGSSGGRYTPGSVISSTPADTSIYTMTEQQLRDRAAQNSANWFGANSAEQTRLHNENAVINALLDARNNTTTTFDAATGAWNTTQGATSRNGESYVAGTPGYEDNDSFIGIYRDPKTGQAYITSNGVNFTGANVNNWAQDKTDYAANALQSRSQDEISTWLRSRELKAEAQGIDISGSTPGIPSNQQIYEQWWNERGQYIPNSFRSWDGSDGVGYYGSDENGDYGYYADPQRTIKLENGNWGVNPNKSKNTIIPATVQQQAQQTPQYQQVQAGAWQQTYNPNAAGNYGGYDLSEFIRQQNAAALEANLATLKDSYDKSMSGYRDLLNTIPQNYNAARNATAAQDALARKQFDERAVAAGLGSGASGQMELSRSAALQSALAGIDQQQQNAEDNINTQMANVTSGYETAIAQAKAEGNMELAQALYNELVRVQNQQRQDAQLSQQYQLQMAQLGAQYGDFSALNSLGIDTSSYEAQLAAQQQIAEQERLAAEEAAKAAANAYKPTFSVAQVQSEINNSRKYGTPLTENVLRDYEYYYGQPYGSTGDTAAAAQAALAGSSGTSGTTSNKGGGTSYNNGGLDKEAVKSVQRAWNAAHPDKQIAVDGYWGPNSQSVTGYGSAKSAQSAIGAGEPAVGSVTNNSLANLDYDPDEGIFTWNGKRYSSAQQLYNDLNSYISRGIITPAVEQALKSKLAMWKLGA